MLITTSRRTRVVSSDCATVPLAISSGQSGRLVTFSSSRCWLIAIMYPGSGKDCLLIPVYPEVGR
jgi:hypothetical protein